MVKKPSKHFSTKTKCNGMSKECFYVAKVYKV